MRKGAVQRKIIFVSTMNGYPWGGSEMLWHDTALRLVSAGHKVLANVCGWSDPSPVLDGLRKAGVTVRERWPKSDGSPPRKVLKRMRSVLNPVLHRMHRRAFGRWLRKEKPDLICVSNGWIHDEQGLIHEILASGMPYTVVVHANGELMWPGDSAARNLIKMYRAARRTFFVSERNRTLLETQLGIRLDNAEVVRNPCNVRRDAAPPWPLSREPVRLACVGRLDPEAKGQDLLFHVLASDRWRSRPVTVSLYGKGRREESLRRLAERLGLNGCVRFCGHADDVERIWTEHHALILPSRFEGLPVTIVEAMLCGRPVIVTDVAGNTEVVEEGVTGFIAEAPTVRHLNLAMERAWENRRNWEVMGKAAAAAIRKLMPEEPAEVFALNLLGLAEDKDRTGC